MSRWASWVGVSNVSTDTNIPPGCVVCGRGGRPRYAKGTARYWECWQCGLLYQHPLPDPRDMQKFADEEYSRGGYREYVRARELKVSTFRERLELIQRRVPEGRLLDVGCACGYLIEVALDAGYDAYGVEFAASALAQASPRVQPRIFSDNVEGVAAKELGAFDVVTAFDIVEHLLDPIRFLGQLRNLLRPGGLLAVTTPDSRHVLRFLMGARWPMLQPLQHTFLFSRRSMRLALERAGFTGASLQRATKRLTLDYLASQIEDHTPAIYRLYKAMSPVLPPTLRGWPMKINIGEMLVLALRPE